MIEIIAPVVYVAGLIFLAIAILKLLDAFSELCDDVKAIRKALDK